ncbi:MAG: ubiquinone/menaquinone biosynthesis C-methylase UbiE/Flp pilus assembly protein TadD [Lentisphaeria bacterium]|jgi:ubiquinone/menaquinone biosynthesis C-methylase UbiE/Flp pilus assembly protein TadD
MHSTKRANEVLESLGDIYTHISKLIKKRHFKAAHKYIKKVTLKRPNNDNLIMMEALVYESEGSYSRALKLCNTAIGLAPNKISYLFRHGYLLAQEGQYENAKTSLCRYLDDQPHDAAALNTVAYVFERLGERLPQLVALLRLTAVQKLTQLQANALFTLSSNTLLFSFSPEVIQGLINLMDYRNVHTRSLSPNIRNYIIYKYKLTSGNNTINIEEASKDLLLLKALPCIRLSHPVVEKFLCALREHLLITTVEKGKLDKDKRNLAQGIALNNFLTEYAPYIKDSELNLLNCATTLLSEEVLHDAWTPHKSTDIVLILSMYGSLYDLPFKEILLKHPIDGWPEALRTIAKQTLFNMDLEIRTSAEIKSLTAIDDKVSLEVQRHYEEHPYPRWNNTSIQEIEHIARFVTNFCPHVKNKLPIQMNDPKTAILIAGSGTGNQPINMALRFPESRITAFDISRRSLAYATIKANEFGIHNIDFYHADILNLPISLGKFYYMECCGVLHHMADPIKGWGKLLELLEPGGVMKVAVYSAMARIEISKEREKIRQLKLKPTAKNIRNYREALMIKTPIHPVVSMFSDFYSLSECRDLLFHQHEKCYTWSEIELACQALHVEFLGLVDNAETSNLFYKEFPDETNSASFEKLKIFECNHPYEFRSMYQFLVKKK